METCSKSLFLSWRLILKAFWSSPGCWSENELTMQSNVVGALGTVQVLVGVFNVGLGPERAEAYPYWLGALFITAGVVSILSDSFSVPCLVGFSVIVNIVGSIFSIVGVVLYAIHLATFTVTWMCGQSRAPNSDNCMFLAGLAKRLLTGVDVTLIIMSVLQLCVCISLTVLSIKSLCNRRRDGNVKDVEVQRSLLKEVIRTRPGT